MTKKEQKIIEDIIKNQREFEKQYELLLQPTNNNPVYITSDIYDEICDILNVQSIYLFGIT